MSESVTFALVIGTLRRPAVVRTLASGTPCATFEVLCRKQLPSGAWVTNRIPCQTFGKAVDKARALQPGQSLCLKGELAVLRTDAGPLVCVSGFDLEPLAFPCHETWTGASYGP